VDNPDAAMVTAYDPDGQADPDMEKLATAYEPEASHAPEAVYWLTMRSLCSSRKQASAAKRSLAQPLDKAAEVLVNEYVGYQVAHLEHVKATRPQVFEDAALAAIGLSNVFGGQLNSATRQIGVLLEDPIRNLTRLRRRGINFNETEKEKIELLLRTGQVLKAQETILKKFAAVQEVARKESELAAGTLDYSAQLIQNFAEQVALAGNVTSSIIGNIGRLNSALKSLLEQRYFIEAWGQAFKVAADAVTNSLEFIGKNAIVLSNLFGILFAMLFARTAVVLGRFSLKMLGVTSAIQGAQKALSGLKKAIKGVGLLTLFTPGGALRTIFSVLTAITFFGFFKKGMQESKIESQEFIDKNKELKSIIESLPKEIRINVESNIDSIRIKMRNLAIERERIEKEAVKSFLRERLMYAPLSGRNPKDAPTVPDNLEEFMAMEVEDEQLIQYQEQVKRINNELKNLENQMERLALQSKFAELGLQNISYAISGLESLEDKLFPEGAKLREQEKVLERLWIILSNIARETKVGLAFIEAGYTVQEIVRLIDEVEAGGLEAQKADDSWKRLAETFEDLQYKIRATKNEILGFQEQLLVDPKIARQFAKLSEEDRNRLSLLNVTPESITRGKEKSEQLVDLQSYLNKISKDRLTTGEKLSAELKAQIAFTRELIANGETEYGIVLDRLEAYAKFKATEPFKELGDQLQEQMLLNKALHDGAAAYKRMQSEIEIENQLSEYRNKLISEDLANREELIEKYEIVLRVIAKVRAENEKLNDEQERYRKLAEDLGTTISNSFEDAIVSGNNLRDVLQGLADDLLRIATRVMITKPLESAAAQYFGGMFSGGGSITAPFTDKIASIMESENGNVMTSSGPMPLRRYSGGGIARTPQLAMFGEGATPEAYVPLPDGRSIPVTMKGSSNVQVNVVNNVGATVTTDVHEGDYGTSIDVMIDKAVAEKVATRGSSTNRSIRSTFGARNTLTRR